jgi:hypothetical protein
VAAPLPRSVPDADRSVIYEFAMDTVMVTILLAVLSILAFHFRSQAVLELKVVALQH